MELTSNQHKSRQGKDTQNIGAFKINLDVSSSQFQTIVHAVAANENRYQFARRSIYTGESQANSNNGVEQSDGKYRLEKGFLGAHSDIGGGYKEGDLSNVALMWMIKQAQEKGNIKFKDYSQYNQVNNPIVHDSLWSFPLFSAGGQFRWATDSSKDYEKTKIFNNFEHLELNWNDTKVFENPNNKKLDKIEDYTATHLANKNKSFFDEAQELPHRKEVLDGKNVLMANEKGKRIAIQDYITWLNHCGYGLNLKTNLTGDDLSKYSKEQLCNPKSLQSLIKTEKQGINGWILLLFAILGLSGCATTNTSNNKTQTTILFRMNNGIWTPESPDRKWGAVLKNNNAILQHCNNNSNHQLNYISWDLTCGTNLKNLEILTVQYAIIPWEKDRAWSMGLDNYIKLQADKLPPSAWRTYTIYPKQLLEKAQSVPPSNEPASQKPQHLRTTVTVTLYIDSNGNVSQDIKHEPVKVGNPYA